MTSSNISLLPSNAYIVSNASGGISLNSSSNGWISGPTFTGSTTIPGVTEPIEEIRLSIKRIEERLNILVPDPKKLGTYEALKAAYNEYKILEALLNE